MSALESLELLEVGLGSTQVATPLPGWHAHEEQNLLVIESAPFVQLDDCNALYIEEMLNLNLIRPCIESERIVCRANGNLFLQWAYAADQFHDNVWSKLEKTFRLYKQGDLDGFLRPAIDGTRRRLEKPALQPLLQAIEEMQRHPVLAHRVVYDAADQVAILFGDEDTPLFMSLDAAFQVLELVCPIDFAVTANALTVFQSELLFQCADLRCLPHNCRLGLDSQMELMMLKMAIPAGLDHDGLFDEVVSLLASAQTCQQALQGALRDGLQDRPLYVAQG
ncbi:MAG: hypothetical protein ACK5NY_00905 [Burkholderiaceae bacterium]|jgi:hypothetical protein